MAVTASAAVAILAIAGCGQSSDTAATGNTQGASSGGAITKAALIRRGDAICAKTDKVQQASLVAYERKHPGAVRTPVGLEAAISEAALKPIVTEIQELAALGAPAGEEATVSAMINGWERALEGAEGNPTVVMKPTGGPFKAPDKLATEYGFEECANAF